MGAFLQRSMSAKKLQDTQSERATGQGETMTQQPAEYITAQDRAAVAALRDYYRANYPPNNDADFMRWIADVLKHNGAADWVEVEKITGEAYPGRGDYRLRCDHCGRDYDLHHCAICGGVTCGSCAPLFHTHNTTSGPTTNGNARG